MTQEQVAAKVLNLKALKLPPEARVVNIRWHPYVDHTGEDSLKVYVILDESTTAETHGWDAVKPVDRAIRDSLLAAGVQLFPYLHFVKQSELDAAGVEV